MMRTMILMGVATLALAGCLPKKDKAAENAATPESTQTETQALAPSAQNAVTFHCGSVVVRAAFDGQDKAVMMVGDQTYHLQSVVSASGAKYETAAGTAPAAMLWNKGDAAMANIPGHGELNCQAQGAKMGTPASMNPVPAQASLVQNTEWQVKMINDAAPVGDRPLTVRFDDQGRISGFSGCNRFTGAYDLNGDTLAIKADMAMTRMACLSDDAAQQETAFTQVLASMTQLQAQADGSLIMRNAQGQQIVLHVPPMQ
ncbi:META domain-containing protein [Micavibrio aeruginosavorus]|uniref:META domain-containing protein n=1 Tax=Micavibrio aeruginosavorus TaxID=349221 RepID=UPI003F4A9B1C